MRWIVCVLALVGCGRVDFDAIEPPGDGRSMDSGDGSSPFCVGGAATTCPGGAVFCDDFESSGGAAFPNWTQVRLGNWNSGGAPDPMTAMTADGAACRGDRSALGHTFGGAQVAFLYRLLPTRPNQLYVRFWFRIASSSSNADFELMGLHDQPNNSFFNIGLDRSTDTIGFNFVGITTTASTTATFTQPSDRWTCMELGVLFDNAAAGQLSLTVDGTTLLDQSNVTTEGSTTLDTLALGVISGLNEPGTFDIEFDEVAVSGSPIGCN